MDEDETCRKDWTNPHKCREQNDRDETVHSIESNGYWGSDWRGSDDHVIVRVTLDDERLQDPWERENVTRGDGSTASQWTSGAGFRTGGGNDHVTLCIDDNISASNGWAEAAGTSYYMVNGHLANGAVGDDEFDQVVIKYLGDRLNQGFYQIESDSGITYQHGNEGEITYDVNSRTLSITPDGIPMIRLSNVDLLAIENIESEEEFRQCFGQSATSMVVSDTDTTSRPTTPHTQNSEQLLKQG